MILWDLVGSCNLKCPSCPMGSMRPAASEKGFITDELFAAILRKLQIDFACRQLHFYNWTEPLLHPRIVQYCAAAVDAGFHVHLSSNLNHLKDPDGILTSGIKSFRVSVSGHAQDTYAIGHRGGRIEKVVANMRRLSESRCATGSRTRIHVYFHKYRHNLDDVPAMASLAKELGFEFFADWAFLMPLEKLLAYDNGVLSAAERDFADQHIVPPVDEALACVRELGGCRMKCELIEQLVLDHRGRASLCCATFDSSSNIIGNYLDLDWEQLQCRRYEHATCSACTAAGAHVLYTNVSHPPIRDVLASLASRAAREPARIPTFIRLPVIQESLHGMAKSA